jgi:hypothetical protein
MIGIASLSKESSIPSLQQSPLIPHHKYIKHFVK